MLRDVDWRPLSVRRGGNDKQADYDALVEGIPGWLEGPIVQWFAQAADVDGGYDFSGRLTKVQMRLRLALPMVSSSDIPVYFVDRVRGVHGEDAALDVIDAVLYVAHDQGQLYDLDDTLSRILAEAGSAWTVGWSPDGFPELQRRMPDEVEARARALLGEGGNPAWHLRKAWSDTYGRSPDPSSAYREAVRAVEAAAKPVIAPQNDRATLGTMIADLKNKPNKWAVGLCETTGLSPVETVIAMLQLLWGSQRDRHGTDDSNATLAVTQADAEAAVHLALTLVQWFTAGAIRRSF